jgi:hypothetical protein
MAMILVVGTWGKGAATTAPERATVIPTVVMSERSKDLPLFIELKLSRLYFMTFLRA